MYWGRPSGARSLPGPPVSDRGGPAAQQRQRASAPTAEPGLRGRRRADPPFAEAAPPPPDGAAAADSAAVCSPVSLAGLVVPDRPPQLVVERVGLGRRRGRRRRPRQGGTVAPPRRCRLPAPDDLGDGGGGGPGGSWPLVAADAARPWPAGAAEAAGHRPASSTASPPADGGSPALRRDRAVRLGGVVPVERGQVDRLGGTGSVAPWRTGPAGWRRPLARRRPGRPPNAGSPISTSATPVRSGTSPGCVGAAGAAASAGSAARATTPRSRCSATTAGGSSSSSGVRRRGEPLGIVEQRPQVVGRLLQARPLAGHVAVEHVGVAGQRAARAPRAS